MMLTLFLGSVEASQGIAANRKVELTAHALADLASQYTAITNADMINILNAALGDHRALSGRRSQGSRVGDCDQCKRQATVVWSDTLNGSGAHRRPDRQCAVLAGHAE